MYFGMRVYKRPLFRTLLSRLKEPRRVLQCLAGPRQVGKTTRARQAMDAVRIRSQYASADEPTLQDRTWIEQQWDLARLKAKDGGALLGLGEGMGAVRIRSQYASADEPTLQDRTWIEQQWDLARLKAKDGGALLVLDEVQKVPGSPRVVKRLGDE